MILSYRYTEKSNGPPENDSNGDIEESRSCDGSHVSNYLGILLIIYVGEDDVEIRLCKDKAKAIKYRKLLC